VASRLSADRRYVYATDGSGTRWRWIGDTFEAGGTRVFDLKRDRGRAATSKEQGATRAPYNLSEARKRREGYDRSYDSRSTVEDLDGPSAADLARIDQEFGAIRLGR
jgi:hypothetical protein